MSCALKSNRPITMPAKVPRMPNDTNTAGACSRNRSCRPFLPCQMDKAKIASINMQNASVTFAADTDFRVPSI
ncbi:hypothetical protein D3C86_2178390 [compost metagenome]